MTDDDIDLHALRHAQSSTPTHERKHCPECGSISLSPRGSSIHAILTDPYRCEHCGAHTAACQDTPGECEHE